MKMRSLLVLNQQAPHSLLTCASDEQNSMSALTWLQSGNMSFHPESDNTTD